MNDTNEPITSGRRVRVVDGALPQYGQLGLVLAPCTEASWYVRLDDAVDERTFFQMEELALATPHRG